MPIPTLHGGDPRPRLVAAVVAGLVLAFPARAQETAPVTFDAAAFRYSLAESASGTAAALGVGCDIADWEAEPAALLALRHELSRFVAGSRDTLPVLVPEPDASAGEAWLAIAALARARRARVWRRVP